MAIQINRFQTRATLMSSAIVWILGLTSCLPKDYAKIESTEISSLCIAGYVETSPNEISLDFYSKTSGIETLKNVSYTLGNDIAAELGICDEAFK